ncbi:MULTISPECIES: copper amine oxidase N-terminal domain-containing protein [Paenibacillus]|uniref:Copper amine oxidase-like N-terminal domain-containing protein n=1 Tax=Paenibacillus albilobatus TaxID=2716884 RepID=A0A919XEF1_9BACL|nr:MULTISPECIES: copper amine oxidase N-terminal domain-containing protein [Paenibacillus]GIO31221.1 hypothetical protein J2TS6_23620 [Paenibacillus albilobatus]
MSLKSKSAAAIAAVSLSAMLTAAPLFSNTVPVASAAAAQKKTAPIQVALNGGTYSFEAAPIMENGTVYIPLRDLGDLLGLQAFWDIATKNISIAYPGTLITMPPGGKEAVINGKKVKLATPVRVIQGRTYVPLRFISESLGIQVQWMAAKRTVAITHSSPYVKGGGVNTAAWLNPKTGEVFISYPLNVKPQSVGKLNVDIKEFITGFEAQPLAGGGLMLRVVDNFGEPHIHNDVYTAYVKNNKILKQAKAYYFKRFERSIVSYNNHPVLLDGKTLTVLDNDGNVLKTYDLPTLGGKDEEYTVAAMGDDYLLIRPNDTGLLTLVNLKDNTRVLLYKELLTPEEQEYSEKNDVPYFGDDLKFYEATADGKLVFYYTNPFDGKERVLEYKRK